MYVYSCICYIQLVVKNCYHNINIYVYMYVCMYVCAPPGMEKSSIWLLNSTPLLGEITEQVFVLFALNSCLFEWNVRMYVYLVSA
jgi:hypothetical protein